MAAVCAVACTSVRLAQKDGCWVKHTETTLGGSKDELGFCAREQPEWSQDRLARLVQECMAQADYRWQNRAIAAWNRNEPIPPQESDAETTKACMSQATQALGLEAENDQLKTRLAELGEDREQLKSVAEKDREFLQTSSDKMIVALGEAAKKPAPNATATATSTTKSESDQRAAAPQPGTVAVVGMPAAAPQVVHTAQPRAAKPVESCPTKAKADQTRAAPRCDAPAEAGPATASAVIPPALAH